jgi:pimeloyl-ACP methyl ester carboxylesterase
MTPIVFLPGMMCDARLFGPQIDVLSAHHPVMSIPINRHDTVKALAADVLEVAPERFALAGLSMGGIVAMEVIHQAPERVERLALMDTNPLTEKDNIKAARRPQMAAAQAGDLRRVMREEMKPNYLTEGPYQGAILDLCMAMAMDQGSNVFVRQSHALMSRPDQSQTLRNYTGPSLVLCGHDDGLCPLHRHELMHSLLPNSTLEVIENAGHLPTLENPTATNKALKNWMEHA